MEPTDALRLLRELKRYRITCDEHLWGLEIVESLDGLWVKWFDIAAVLPVLAQQQDMELFQEWMKEKARADTARQQLAEAEATRLSLDAKIEQYRHDHKQLRCDHKFIDSVTCLKCGWNPTAESDPERARTL